MGLFVAKQIVKKFNGELDFVSDTSGDHPGSTFIFTMDLEVNIEQ
jgi:signal transduction histidine kinase